MVLREGRAGFAVYMTRRSSRSRFMPDAYVFPGGAVDLADGDPPESYAVAALRELFEEAGILIARDEHGAPSSLDPQVQAELRARGAAGAPLAALLAERGLRFETSALTYYSNWITPASEPIRFDAHFFVTRAPSGQSGEADAIEVHDGMWIEPKDALDRAARNELTIRFPTQKHLERLARFETVDAFLAHAKARVVLPVEPFDDGTEAFGLANGPDSW
jgi:8-oxo-dGTP pyrophosphatase MutT (NUDIX family)